MSPLFPDKMSFMEHLGELRVRIVRSLVALLVGLAIALPLSQRLTDYLAKPIQATGNTLVFLAVTEAFWVQMKVAVIAGLFIASPGILWQVWRFIAPGLYQHEKKYAMPFVIIGSLLFITGGAFSLFVVTPYAIQFLLSYARPGLQPMISVGSYIDFLLKFTLAFGDADARCLQSDVDGGPAHHPVRSGDRLRAHLRAQAEAGARGRGDSSLA